MYLSNRIIELIIECLVGLVVASVIAEYEAPGSVTTSGKLLPNFSVKTFPVAVRSLGDGDRKALCEETGISVR